MANYGYNKVVKPCIMKHKERMIRRGSFRKVGRDVLPHKIRFSIQNPTFSSTLSSLSLPFTPCIPICNFTQQTIQGHKSQHPLQLQQHYCILHHHKNNDIVSPSTHKSPPPPPPFSNESIINFSFLITLYIILFLLLLTAFHLQE